MVARLLYRERVCKEEVGAKLKSLKKICTVCWEWADNPKRKERYKRFRGEKIHLMIGEVEEFVEPTSQEGDAWKGKKLMSIPTAIWIIENSSGHPYMYPYRIAQATIM